jgi:hypothetical protein
MKTMTEPPHHPLFEKSAQIILRFQTSMFFCAGPALFPQSSYDFPVSLS